MGAAVEKPPKYIIDLETWKWMHNEFFLIYIVFQNIAIGMAATGWFYLMYVCLKEFIMDFPYNYMDFLAGKVEESSLIWPKKRPRDTLNYAELDA